MIIVTKLNRNGGQLSELDGTEWLYPPGAPSTGRAKDGVLIGHNAVLATINHMEDPEKRAGMIFQPIHIEKNVWLGANVTVLPGVTISEGSIIAAGAVVTKDVPVNMIAAGVPAKVIRKIKKDAEKGEI